MTIICAASWGREAWIGCDSAGTDGHGHQKPYGTKLLEYPWGVMGFSGSYRLPQAINKTMRKVDSIETYDESLRVVEIVEGALQGIGWSRSASGELPKCNAASLLMVSRGGRIWSLQSDLAILQAQGHDAIGSGYLVAEGAMEAIKLGGGASGQAVRMGLRAACGLVSSCGGRLHTKRVR